MQIKFQSKTAYTTKVYQDFHKFHINNQDNLKIILGACCLGSIFLAIYFLICFNFLFAIILVVVAILFALSIFTNFIPKMILKETNKKNPHYNELVEEYKFYDNRFTFTNNMNDNMQSILYKDLYEVYETKDYFYLYLDKLSCLVIIKSEITKGTSEALAKLLKSKCSHYYEKVRK